MKFFVAAVVLCLCHQSLAGTIGQRSESQGFLSVVKAGQPAPFEVDDSAVQALGIPPDDGRSNYGDLVYGARVDGDERVYGELVLLPSTFNVEKDLQWHVVLKQKVSKITTVRALNLGRQRVYVQRIDVSHAGEVLVSFTVPAKVDPRLAVEVYGK